MGDQNSIIAVVTGASRGLGRGIARALGSKGATVYVTGRAAEGALEDAAREVTEQGGKGIAIACDHPNDGQVTSLFERVNADEARRAILVKHSATVFPELLPP